MIRFIYGNPGTGKTYEVYRALKADAENSQKALLIVPEQMAVSAERKLLMSLPPSAQLNIEVVNFSRLANKIFREHGGLSYNLASKALQKLVMWRAISKAAPFLTEYKSNGKDDMSLASAMLATYKEMTASGVSPEMLEAAEGIESGSLLYNKVKDIATVCSIYSTMISDKCSDENDELRRLCKVLEEKNCLAGYSIYIDGFTSLTGLEHMIVKVLMRQASRLWITLPIESQYASSIDSVSIKRCSDKLRRDAAALGIASESLSLVDNKRAKYEDIAFISENLWELNSAETCGYSTSVELWKSADIYDECESAAARARELVESGYKYKDIVIVSRNADKYRGIIEPALDSMELKYFFSEKTDPALCPVSRLILSALRIANYGWRREDVIAHLKTGLCRICSHDADIFEAYTAKWNISGKKFTDPLPWNMNPDGYTVTMSERGREILEISNSVKEALSARLSKYISELKAAETCNDICIATYNYLEELNVSDSLKDLSIKFLNNGKVREASETARMYDVILDSLDCVCDAFSDDDLPDLITFSTALRTALEESELGSIPTSSDEITIGSADMLRADDIKCAIILGACDGEFPANAQSSGLLSDSDRDILTENNIKLSGDRELRASDELFYFRRAVSVASEKIIIYTRADSEPSIAFSRINALSKAKITNTSDHLLSKIRTYRALSEYLPLLEGTDEGLALARLWSESSVADKYAVADKLKNPISSQNDTIDSATIHNIIGRRLMLSQSKIESYVNCRFAYSCKYFLKLDEGKKAKFAFNNIGTFVHHVLEKYLFFVFIENGAIFPGTVERDGKLNSIIDDYIDSMIPDDNGQKSARLLHLISRLKKLAILLIDDITLELSDSSFKPEFFELPIGNTDMPSVQFTLNDGTEMSLSGIIDRVDTFRKDGKVYIRVIDYKTGSKTFSINDIKEGINLQLLLYIYSLTNNKDPGFQNKIGGEPVAAAVTYISAATAKAKAERINLPECAIKNASAEIKRSGVILDTPDVLEAVSKSANDRYLMKTSRRSSAVSEESFKQLFELVSNVMTDIGNEIITGNANAIPKDGKDSCKYCPYSIICRNSEKSDK